MQHNFRAVILSYKNTPLSIREQVAFDESSTKRLLRELREVLGIQEALVLSTCNRTEIYYHHEADLTSQVIGLIKVDKHLSSDIAKYFEDFSGKEAAKHLFRVSLGLEAQVIGDMQISNQVKSAYQWSADEDMAGPFLHRLMHTIFFSNKRVVQETAFRDGAASVSYAACELVKDLTRDFTEPKVLVLGLGEIGEDMVRNLKEYSNCDVTITNRTFSKAEALASELEYKTRSFEGIVDQIRDFDVVISSIRSDQLTISKQHLVDLNILSHKFFIDLSVPRSIASEIEEVPGVLLYNIDDIHDKANEALERRKRAIPAVEQIVTESLVDFDAWAQEMEVSPTIQKLKNALEDIRKTELSKHLKKATPDQEEILEVVTKSMMQKIIKLPVLQLKAACKRGEAETLIDVLNDLFNLENQPVKK